MSRRQEWQKVSKHRRRQLYDRDPHTCHYCGARLADLAWPHTVAEVTGGYIAAPGYTWAQVDHVIPLAHGGTNDLANLVLCCGPCNVAKGAATGLPTDGD